MQCVSYVYGMCLKCVFHLQCVQVCSMGIPSNVFKLLFYSYAGPGCIIYAGPGLQNGVTIRLCICSVQRIPISVETFLPISAPNPINKPQ